MSFGAGDFEHLNGSLIAHLTGTYDLLNRWGASKVACDAGLFHAAYGTAGFNEAMVSLNKRNGIAKVIGAEAEKLVYLYCSCDRDFTFPNFKKSGSVLFRDRFSGKEFELSDEQAKEFCEITVANELELILASDEFKAKYGEELLELFISMEKYLSEQAIATYKSALVS